MSNASIPTNRPELRRDLTSQVCSGGRRAYRLVIDEIGGRFARVSDHLWRSLQRGDADDSLWRAAQAAGWTRSRAAAPTRTFHPLFIRIPIGSIDAVAARLAQLSGWLFAPVAMLFWSTLILLALLLAVGRGDQIFGSIGSLQQFFVQCNPVVIGSVFVATKIAHELGHAVMCRRVGSRCGSVGVLLLCGMPCPYCDVTDLWRQSSTTKRIAVMLAGIYVELILTTIATFIWLWSSDPSIRLHALNIMIVCGISTILFNANPLMRYDGYYVLADLVGSTNLRQESSDAFRGVVISALAGSDYGIANRRDGRSIGLAAYHGMSTIYRWLILTAIAAFCVQIAEYFRIRQIAVPFLILAILMVLIRKIRTVASAAGGIGPWVKVPRWRRFGLITGLGSFVLLILFVPLPRYRRATGWIDAADATAVYLDHAGMIQDVGFDFGDQVVAGDPLVRLENDSLSVQHAKLEGQLRMASLRRELSRRVTLDRSEPAQQWSTLEAAENAVAAQLAFVDQRIQRSLVTAPIAGTILPSDPTVTAETAAVLSLRRRVGTATDAYQSWCRISRDGAIEAVLILDARDRSRLNVGTKVKISVAGSSSIVLSSTIQSVSAIESESELVTRAARYQVICPLQVEYANVLPWLGKECIAVFHLPPRSLANDIGRWVSRWIDGELS